VLLSPIREHHVGLKPKSQSWHCVCGPSPHVLALLPRQASFDRDLSQEKVHLLAEEELGCPSRAAKKSNRPGVVRLPIARKLSQKNRRLQIIS
jgi:hypothetical protein